MSILAAIAAVTAGTALAADSSDPREIARSLLRGRKRKHSIDLKYSIWSTELADFEERYPRWREMFEDIAWAANSDPGRGHQVIIHSAPSKEIRGGTIKIEDGEVDVDLWSEWDAIDAPDWAHELLANDRIDLLEGIYSSLIDWHIESEIEGFSADPRVLQDDQFDRKDLTDFNDLIVRIDDVEDKLLEKDKRMHKKYSQAQDRIVLANLPIDDGELYEIFFEEEPDPDDDARWSVIERLTDLGLLASLQDKKALKRPLVKALVRRLTDHIEMNR